MTRCTDCATDLHHCHGMLVVHDDGRSTCVECEVDDLATHQWAAPCTDPCCHPEGGRAAA